MHFDNLPADVMERRIEAQSKRLSEVYHIFGFLEYGQRKKIPGCIKKGIDNTILENKDRIKQSFEETWTAEHECEVKGCDKVITIDGGMKPTRFLCANKLGGVTEFSDSGLKVVTGCKKTLHPIANIVRIA